MSITLLTFQEATRRYNITSEQLQSLVRDGTMEEVVVDGRSMVIAEELRKVADKNGNDLQWISLSEAVEQYSLSKVLLERLAKDGVIRSGTLDDELQLAVEDISSVAGHLDKLRLQHLENVPIAMGEAAEKYGFPIGSIFRWTKQGHIRTIKSSRRRPILLNEADVAYTKALAEIRGRIKGRALFPTSLQYTPVWLTD